MATRVESWYDANVDFENTYHFDARMLRDVVQLQQKRYNLALILGPLYHLLDSTDRCVVLMNFIGMIEPGGFVAAAFVSRNAHLRDVCMRDPARLKREPSFYQQYLRDGRYARALGRRCII
jgi:S-adenosylmethionine-dependent methyltransferase